MINRKVILILAACAFPLAAGEIPEKAERYRTMLLKKPENPVLFGRMLDAWLEEKELEALKPELEQRAKDGATADWRLLAVYHEHSGDEAAALKALDEAVRLSPDDAATRLARGKALGAALRFEAALEDLAVAAKDKEVGVEAGTLRGKMLARAGRPAEAVKAWQELIAANPADEGLKEDLIELEIGEGMLEEAITAARELAEKTDDPYKKALRRLQVAEIQAQAGKKEESLKEYRDVFAVSADGSWLEREVLARAGALFSREDDSEGLKEFLGGLREAYPRRVAVKKEAAKALLAAGEEDEAIAMFREVLKVLPGDREVREEFIGLLEGAERAKEAAEELAALLETAKDDAALWERLAVLKKALKDEAGLKEALDKTLALTPDDEGGLVARARLWGRFERFDDAEKVLRDALAKHGHGGESGEALAAFLVARDKGDQAVALWKEMAATADREGLLRIARSLSAHGKAGEAYALLQPRAKDFPDDALLLAALCQAAQLGDDPEAAVPQALALVKQAKSPTDLDTALRLATSLIARTDEPRKWLDELAKRNDLTLSERCLLSEIHETLGDSIAAEQVLKEAMAGDDSLLAATQRVRLHEIRGDMEAAVAAMREMMALPGGMKTAHVKKLVELLERDGDMAKALEATDEWLKLAPGDKAAWTKRAELLLGDGRPAEAVAELRRALAKFGGEEELREKLAEAQREAGMTDEAWRSFTALYDEAESPASKLKWAAGLARMAEVEGKEEELIADFRRRARDNPSSPLPLLALADMYREWQLPDDELKCVAEASRRKAEDAALKFRMADLEEQAGNADASAAILRGLLGTADAPEARRRLGAFWIRQGDTERGLRELAEGDKSADPRTVEKLVMPLVRAKEWDAAATVMARETAAHPDDWRLAYLHAVILLEGGKMDEAAGRFAVLLEKDGELKHAPPPPQGMNWQGYPGMNPAAKKPVVSRKAIPEFLQYQNQVLSFKDPDRYGHYAGMQPGDVPLPATADALRRMALVQLMVLAKDEEEKRPAIVAKIASSHFEDLESFKRVFFLTQDELKALVMGDRAAGDDFRWFLQNSNMGHNQGAPDKDFLEVVKRGVELTSADDPELALWLANRLPLDGDDGTGAEGAKQRLDLYKRLDEGKRKNNFYNLQSIAFAGDKVPEALKGEAETLFIAELEKVPGGLTGNWYAMELAGRWLREGKLERGIEWLNRLQAETERDPKKAQQAANRYRMNYGWGMGSGNRQGYPQVLGEFAPQVFQALGRNRHGGMALTDKHKKLLKLVGDTGPALGGQPPQKDVDLEALAALAGKLNDPLQRICVHEQAGKEKEVAREIAALEAKPDAGAAELLLVAYFHAKKSPEKSYAMLVKARDAADAGDWRDRIEQELVTTGVKLAESRAGGVDLDPARRAALRMRRTVSFNPELKAQLAGWLTALGMEEESKRFTAGPSTGFAKRNMRNYHGVQRGSSGRRNANEDAARLVKDGKREAAARVLLAGLRQMTGNPNASYETDRLLKTAKSLKLDQEMVKLGAPGEDAGYNRRKDHALLLISLERKDDAAPLLRKLAEEKPGDLTVKTALYSVLKPGEQIAQAKELAKGDFDGEVLSVLFNTWVTSDSAGKRLDGLEAMTGLLENLEPTFKSERNLSWVNYFVNRVATDDYVGTHMSPLFTKPDEGNKYHKENSERRAEVCKRLFRAMLRHPQTAEQGFVLLDGTREVLGAEKDELDAAAVGALRLVIRLEPPPLNRRYYSSNRRDSMWSWMRGNGGSTSAGGPPKGLLPSAWLATRATEGKAIEPYDREFIRSLAKEGGDWAETIETCEAVAAAPGLEKFNEWKKTSGERPQRAAMELEWISRAAASAKRDDLRAAIEDHMCEALRGGTADTSAFASELARRVEEAKDHAGRTAVLRRLVTKILGPEEAWPLYADLNNSGIYLQGPGQRLNAFQNLYQSLGGSDATIVSATRFAASHGLGFSGSLNWYQIFNHSGGAEIMAKRMQDAGLFAPGPEAIAELQDGNNTCVLEYGLSQLKSNGDTGKKVGEQLLKADGPDRFWARVSGAVLADKPEAAYAELKRESATIAKWPPSGRDDLSRFLSKWLPDAANNADPAVRRLLAESNKKGDAEAKQKAEEYLKDGFGQNVQLYSSNGPVQSLVGRLVADDPELAAKLWNKALEHMRAGSPGWSSSSGGFGSTIESYAHAELLESLLNRKTPFGEILEFMAAFERQPSAKLIGQHENNFRYYLWNAIREEGRRRDAEVKKLKLPAGLSSEAGIYTLLGKSMPEKHRGAMGAMVISANTYNQNWNFPDGWREGLAAWSGGELAKLGPAYATAVKLSVLSQAGDRLDDAGKAELKKCFAAYVAEPSVPAGLKFSSLASLLHNTPAGKFDDPACAKAMADFLCGYLTPEVPWANYQSAPALGRFATWTSLAPDDAKRLLAAFEKSRIDYATNGSDVESARGSVAAMNLSLAMRAGDAAGISKAARAGAGVRGRLDLALRLWEAGLGDSAKLLVARPGEYHRGGRVLLLGEKPGDMQFPAFSKELEAALPEWLKVVDDPGQRFRIECLVSALEDAKDAAAPAVKRADRLAALAKRFPAEAPKPRVSRMESLAAIASEATSAAGLEEEFATLTRGSDLGSLVLATTASNYGNAALDREEQSVLEALLRKGSRLKIELSGDAADLIKQVESIQVIGGGNSEYYASQMMDRFFDWQATLLIRRIHELDGGKKKAAAAQALKLCEVLLAFDNQEMQLDAIALGIMSQLAAGDGSAFDRWLDGLPEETRKRYDKVRKERPFSRTFATIHESCLSDAEHETPRRELLAALLTDPATLKREIKHPTDLSGLLDSKAFTRDDIVAVVDGLPAEHPMKAKFLTEKAGIIGWRTDEKETAIKAFDTADAAAKASGDAKSIAYARAYRAKWTDDRQKKPAEAAAIAREIKLDDLDEKERKWMEELIKKSAEKK